MFQEAQKSLEVVPRQAALTPYASATLNQGGSQELLSLPLVLHALRRWWKLATLVGLILAGGIVAAVYVLFKPIYEASAWVQIEDRQSYIAFEQVDRSSKFVETQVQLLRSPLVLAPVLADPKIAKLEALRNQQAPLDYLARLIRITPQGASELFTVSWQGTNPAEAAAIVNAVVDSYMRQRQQWSAERSQRVISLLQEERTRQQHDVELLEQQLRELTKQIAAKDPQTLKKTDMPSPEMQQVTSLQAKLTEAALRRVFLQAEVATYEESMKVGVVAKQQVEEALAKNPLVQSQEAQLALAQASLRDLEQKLSKGTADPHYQAKAAALQQQRETFNKIREDLRVQVQSQLAASQTSASQDRMAKLKSELKSMELAEDLMKKQLETARGNIAESGKSSVEMEFLQSELRREEEAFTRIASRLLALRTEQRAPDRVMLLRIAEVPTLPVIPLPYKYLAVACTGVFLFPFGLAIVWERWSRRVVDTSDLGRHVQMTVMGEITRLPARSALNGPAGSSRQRQDIHLFQESVDSLRVRLATSESTKNMRVFAVTSAVNHEGKTSVAVQLAVSLARASGAKTLLIDGDMRSPDVHRVLQTPSGPGLAEVLGHECTLEEAAITPWSKNVDVLPAGSLSCSPHLLLGNGNFYTLLEQLRSRYDYIVIDTPPVLAASEALILSRAAEGCLLCTMRDVSRLTQINETRDRLQMAGVTSVGVVLNGVPLRQYGYRYGHYGYDVHSAEA